MTILRDNFVHPLRDTTSLDPTADCLSDFRGAKRGFSLIDRPDIAGQSTVHLLQQGETRDRLEVWNIPALGCLEARRLMSFRNENGALTDTSDLIATKISRGEPSLELFAVPPDFAEVKPSEAYGLLMKRIRGKLCDLDLKMLQLADDEYARNRVSAELVR